MLKVETLLLILDPTFLLLLVLDVLFYHLLIKTDRANKITARPKVVAPIRFLLELRIALEKFYRQLSFQSSHQLRYRNFGRYRNQKMYMVFLNVQLLHKAPFPFAQHTQVMLHQFFYRALEYAKTIFRNPNYMIVTFIDNMA